MKMTKKMTALMLAMSMAAAGTTAAYGDPGVSATDEVKSAGGSTNMTLTGNIQVTTLSVTIPTTVAFDVDMTKIPVKSATDKAGVNVQVTGPTETDYRIINKSASTVWVYVTAVTPSATSTGKTPALVSKYSDLKAADYNLLFAIKDTKVAPPVVNAYTDETDLTLDGDSADFWMKSGMASGDKYYLNSDNGKLLAQDQATGEKENEMPLTIYAFTRKGWVAGDSFTVQPTFTVSVTDPTKPTT
ncbi:MAG: hypothetical protein KHZ58_16560 [Hungatella hathewayi]|nr:hypothetical protein [Hungatella hathewayi]